MQVDWIEKNSPRVEISFCFLKHFVTFLHLFKMICRVKFGSKKPFWDVPLLNFHHGNGYLDWCWKFWKNLYNNIPNVLWKRFGKLEMNIMNIECPLKHFKNNVIITICYLKDFLKIKLCENVIFMGNVLLHLYIILLCNIFLGH